MAVSAQAATRTFTNQAGRKIEAEIVEVSGANVVLKMGGKNYPVPIASLSAADQTYIKEWGEKQSRGGGSGAPVEGNWDGDWPRLISASVSQDIEILKEDGDEFVYASDHYEYHCDVKLNTSVVKRFALLFEATNLFMRELPLGMVKPFQEKRFRIELCERMGTYHERGGPQGSAGVYFSGGNKNDVILVPLGSLGVKRVGSSFSVDYKKENKTLSHEICHQLTDREYYAPGARGWFTEGLAEYIGTSGYRSGKFNVDDLSALKAYVTAYGEDGNGGRALGETIRLPNLDDWMQQSYSSFLNNAGLNYGAAALIVYYFFHMDGEKDAARIKAFLKEIKAGTKCPEAYDALLDGRTFEELEEDITKAWRGRGIRFEFR